MKETKQDKFSVRIFVIIFLIKLKLFYTFSVYNIPILP